MKNILTHKHDLEALGFQCVPCEPKSKACKIPGWQTKTFSDANFPPNANIAVFLGSVFVDVDHDCTESVLLGPYLLLPTNCIWGRDGSPRSHWVYRSPSAANRSFSSGHMIVEMRTGLRHTVAPGSTHPSGEVVKFYEKGAPSEVDPSDLLQRCSVIAATALVARDIWGKGNHHGPALGLAGVFAKGGVQIELAEAAMQGLAKEFTPHADLNDLLSAVQDTYAAHAAGKPISGIKALKDAGLSEDAADAIGKWLPPTGGAGKMATSTLDVTLITEQQPAPAFPVSALGSISGWVQSAADGANAPVDFTAAALLTAVSAVLANVRRVEVRSGWSEHPILWCIQVGPPSSGKTPASKSVLKCVAAIEAAWDQEHRTKVQAQIDDVVGQLAMAEAKSKKGIERDLEKLESTLEEAPRYMAMDSTIEALAHIQKRSPRGVLVYYDEISGLVSNLSRYSNGSDRTYYIQSWNGGGYRVDRRKSGGSLYLPHHSLAIMGGIQPDMLESLLIAGKDDDGFLARFLIFAPVNIPPYAPADGPSLAPLEKALSRLASLPFLPGDLPMDVGLTAEALAIFHAWADQDQITTVTSKGMLGSAFGKFRGYCVRLSLVLCFLDWAWIDDPDMPAWIGAKYVHAAILLIEEYFRPQARRLYQAADWTPEERLARALLMEARQRNATEFNARHAFRSWGIPGASGQGATRKRDAALKLLEEAGWIEKKSSDGPGRPSSDYVVSPALWQNL